MLRYWGARACAALIAAGWVYTVGKLLAVAIYRAGGR